MKMVKQNALAPSGRPGDRSIDYAYDKPDLLAIEVLPVR